MSNAIFELGVKHGRSRLIARLANPDEALVEAVAKVMCSGGTTWNECPSCYGDSGYEGCGNHWRGWAANEAPKAIRALALALSQEGENTLCSTGATALVTQTQSP